MQYDFDRLGEVRGDRKVEPLQRDCHQEASDEVLRNSLAVGSTDHDSRTYFYGSRARL